MRLTLAQAQRLFGVGRAVCQHVLDTLVEMNFLRVTAHGTYARVTDGVDYPRPHPAKADLKHRPSAFGASSPTGQKRLA
jgi:hypothetical protein